jgi:hypothetical protein
MREKKSSETKMQEVVDCIIREGGDDLVLVMVVLPRLRLLNEEVDPYHKAKAAGATGRLGPVGVAANSYHKP